MNELGPESVGELTALVTPVIFTVCAAFALYTIYLDCRAGQHAALAFTAGAYRFTCTVFFVVFAYVACVLVYAFALTDAGTGAAVAFTFAYAFAAFAFHGVIDGVIDDADIATALFAGALYLLPHCVKAEAGAGPVAHFRSAWSEREQGRWAWALSEVVQLIWVAGLERMRGAWQAVVQK